MISQEYITFICKFHIVQFQKVSILPPSPTEGIGILGVGDPERPKHLKKCMKRNWNFQRGGRGMDISGTTCTHLHAIFKIYTPF